MKLAEPLMLPDGPAGTRVIVEVEELVMEGERLRAHLKGRAAADWLTVNPALLGTIDVRALLETDDGALIYTSYTGRLDLSAGPGTSPAYSAPLYETGDERYAWLNKIQAVAKGSVGEGGHVLDYEIAEVV
jgi:hypothetical protein